MRRPPFARSGADPLALDDTSVDRLLTGALPPASAPPGYAGVAELLAATVAPPAPRELAGQAAVLAELRAVTARPPAATTASPARPRRRRRAGLAVVVVVGALATGGVAAAATGHLPEPVRAAARSILATSGVGEPAASTPPGRPPPVTRTAGSGGTGLERSGSAVGPGHGPGPTAAGPAAGPNPGLCQAFLAGNGAEQGKKLEATAFEALAKLAGGQEKIPAYCRDVLPGRAEPKEKKEEKQEKDQAPSGGRGQEPEQGHGGPPASTSAGNQGQP